MKKTKKALALALALAIAGTSNLSGLENVSTIKASSFVTTDQTGNKVGITSDLGYLKYNGNPIYSINYVSSGHFTDGSFQWSYDYVRLSYHSRAGISTVDCAVNLTLTRSLSQNDTDIVLPSSVTVTDSSGKLTEIPVIELGYRALADNEKITSVTIPGSYITIDAAAFSGCSNLQNVTYAADSQLQKIGDYAFNNCTSLKSAYIPSSLLTPLYGDTTYYQNTCCRMGNNVYQGCTSITEVEITGASTIVIPQSLFSACQNLSKVTIGNDVEKLVLCKSAFADTNISKLEFDCDLIIGDFALARIPNLEKVTFNGAIEYISTGQCLYGRMFAGSFKNTKGGKVEFNNKTVNIPATMFCDTTGNDASHGLNEVSFGDNVAKITVGAYAFSNTGIENLKFAGNTTIDTRGLAALGSYTKTVEFNGTTANIMGEAFAGFSIKSSSGNSSEPYLTDLTNGNVTSATNNTTLEKIIINTENCNFANNNSTYHGYDIFYGIDNQCTLTFGENVKELLGAVKNFTYNNVTRQGWGDIQKVYIQSPYTNASTTFALDDNAGGNCTIYGYQKTNGENNKLYDKIKKINSTTLQYSDYVTALYHDDKNIKDIVNSVGFQEDTLSDVHVTTADRKNKYITYEEDTNVWGYHLTEESKEKLESLKNSDTGSRTSIAIWCGSGNESNAMFDISVMVNVIPKSLENFDVTTKSNAAFICGEKPSADAFTIEKLYYNDKTNSIEIDKNKINVSLKSGLDEFTNGENTVVIEYEGVKKELSVIATQNEITSISATLNDDTTYYVGDKIDITKIVVTPKYQHDTESTQNTTVEYTKLSDTILTKEGANEITVYYNDLETTMVVSAAAVAPTKIYAMFDANCKYYEGQQTIDPKTVLVTVEYNNGTKKSGADLAYAYEVTKIQDGATTIQAKISYAGLESVIEIPVTPKEITRIKASANIASATEGTTLSKTIIDKIEITYNNGKTETLDASNIDYNNLTFNDYNIVANTQNTITVNYAGKTSEITIWGVSNSITRIYAEYIGSGQIVGTQIPASDIAVHAINANGQITNITEGILLENAIPYSVGPNTVTVHYGSFSCTIIVTGLPVPAVTVAPSLTPGATGTPATQEPTKTNQPTTTSAVTETPSSTTVVSTPDTANSAPVVVNSSVTVTSNNKKITAATDETYKVYTNKNVVLTITSASASAIKYQVVTKGAKVSDTAWKDVVNNKITVSKTKKANIVYIQYTDANGAIQTIHTNGFTIDKKKATVNVKKNKTYKAGKKVTFKDTSGIKSAKLDGKKVKSGVKVKKKGTHTLVVTDKAGNKTTIKFKVK